MSPLMLKNNPLEQVKCLIKIFMLDKNKIEGKLKEQQEDPTEHLMWDVKRNDQK